MSEQVTLAGRKVNESATRAWTEEEKDLIKRTVALGGTDDEIDLFEAFCRRTGLDPLMKEAHFIVRHARDPRRRKVVFIAGIHGLLSRANKEPDCRGIQSGVVTERDEFQMNPAAGEVEHWKGMDSGRIIGAWARVHREGMTPFLAWARFEEFNDRRNHLWRVMPHMMIEKVAKAAALRLAYPNIFGNVRETAEVPQTADPPHEPESTELGGEESPRPQDSAPPSDLTETWKAFRDKRAEAQPDDHVNRHRAVFKRFCATAIGRDFTKTDDLTDDDIGKIASIWNDGRVDVLTGEITGDPNLNQ